jgi:hypothetical protein
VTITDKHGVALKAGDRLVIEHDGSTRHAHVVDIDGGAAVCELMGDPLPGEPYRFIVQAASSRRSKAAKARVMAKAFTAADVEIVT